MYSVLIAPDSFKGTLTADEVCDIIGRAFKDTIKDIKITKLPAADGGEGLCACLKQICGGETVRARVSGVFGEKMTAEYLMLDNKTAVIETAACAGLPLAGERKNPERATTYGVGELIMNAAKNGAKKILLGLGGSATNDCGFGMAAALGWRFVKASGEPFVPVGGTLCETAAVYPPEKSLGIPVTAACDVENPLFGKNGAAYVFAPQKGADEAMVKRLDLGLRHSAKIIEKALNINIAEMKGAGAAGGLGAGAAAFLGAELKKGIDIILDAAEFDEKASQADLIITGEGRLDFQSAGGKVVSGVAARAAARGKRAIAICGSRGEGAEEIKKLGISRLYFACKEEKPFEEIIKTCREDLFRISLSAAEDIIKALSY